MPQECELGSKFIDELQLGAPSWTGQTHWKYQNIVLMHKSTVLHQTKFREGIVRQTKAERIQNPFVLQHQEAVKPFKHPTGVHDIWIYLVNFDHIKLLVLHKSVASSRVACARGEAIVVHGHVLQVLVAWARFYSLIGGPQGAWNILKHTWSSTWAARLTGSTTTSLRFASASPGCGRRSGRAVHWATHHPPRAAPRPSLQAALDSLSASMTPLGRFG